MSFKCTPQIIGLTRQNNPTGKHRANGKAVAGEMGKKNDSGLRHTNSVTYHAELSTQNKYSGFDNGFDAWSHMKKQADEYRAEVKGKNGQVHHRDLREDAVIGFAMIINPPDEVCRDWTDDEYSKFYNDTFRCVNKICPGIFRQDNIVMTAEHYDEGATPDGKSRHLHILGNCIDENGKYIGKKIDPKFFDTLGSEYPKMMRDLGWDMEDLDKTDWERYKTDPDYRAERDAKRRTHGLANEQYVKKETAEKSAEVLDNARQQAEETLDNARQQAETVIIGVKAEVDKKIIQPALELKSRTEQERAELDTDRSALNADRAALDTARAALNSDRAALNENISVYRSHKKKLEDDRAELDAQRHDLGTKIKAFDNDRITFEQQQAAILAANQQKEAEIERMKAETEQAQAELETLRNETKNIANNIKNERLREGKRQADYLNKHVKDAKLRAQIEANIPEDEELTKQIDDVLEKW